jgi:tetratricopeptide (TPR) repeat protein
MGYTKIKNSPLEIDHQAISNLLLKKQFSTIRCTPDWTTYFLSKAEILQMMPLPGTGAHKWKISTKNDSAQFYFNQGINLYYGFHIIEALPSFKKGQTFDSTCAMLYWAEALAYGPNINDLGYAASPDALIATKKASELKNISSEKEKNFIDAMQVRYSNDSTKKREILNQLYADRMKSLYKKFPVDAEIGALYADALMIQHPWDLWQHNGQPKTWTPQIEKVLENVLKISPDHPGANHYYIHTMEASPYAYKATANADRLGRLAPGLSHMVHMPSHIYIRTGNYKRGEEVNKAAIESYNTYLNLYPDVVNNAPLYEIHNRHMKAACSMNMDNYAFALKDAVACRKSFDTSFLSMDAPVGDFIQYVYMTPELTMLTFEKWDDIIEQPDVPFRYHYAYLLQHFAKGMAYANTNKIEKSKFSLANLESILSEKDLSVVFSPFNAPLTGANTAKYILMGTIAEKEIRIDQAIQYYKLAVATEDSMIYNEPRDWLTPARHYLGNALLHAKKYKEAAKIFRADLKVHPKNYISTKGLKAATAMTTVMTMK